MIFIYVVSAIVLIAFAFLLIWSYTIFLRVCKRKERSHSFDGIFSQIKLKLATKERLQNEFEWSNEHISKDIVITSADGFKLFADVIYADPTNKINGVIVLMHGFRSFGRRDFCLQIRHLHDAGYHLIIADQRSHSRSEGKYISYGVKEHRDALLWCEKAVELFGKKLPIALMGLSMGGATVLMASRNIDHNFQVRCIVADCPFSSPWEIVKHVLKTKHHIFPYPVIYFINFWCKLLADFDLREISATSAVAESDIPILILHGAADKYVPPSFSKEIAMTDQKRVKLVLFDGAAHAEAIFFDEEGYMAHVLSFLEKNM